MVFKALGKSEERSIQKITPVDVEKRHDNLKKGRTTKNEKSLGHKHVLLVRRGGGGWGGGLVWRTNEY